MAFKMKLYSVYVAEFGSADYYARSPGQALAKAWRGFPYDHSFKEFMKIARARRANEPENFGEKILVGGEPAFRLTGAQNPGAHVHFVRPDSDVVLLSHPLDVQPAT